MDAICKEEHMYVRRIKTSAGIIPAKQSFISDSYLPGFKQVGLPSLTNLLTFPYVIKQ